MKAGTVVWFRNDGTGYIKDCGSEKHHFLGADVIDCDASELDALDRGQSVYFLTETVAGQELVSYAKLS